MAGSSSSTLQSLDKHAFSAPVLSVLSEEGNIISTDEDILGIDSYTGLPRLPVELLPEMADDSSKRRSVTFEPTKTQGSPSLGKEEKVSVAVCVSLLGSLLTVCSVASLWIVASHTF